MYDNSGPSHDIIAFGSPEEATTVVRTELWSLLERDYGTV